MNRPLLQLFLNFLNPIRKNVKPTLLELQIEFEVIYTHLQTQQTISR